ncbi:MAG: hypothetical protein BWX95_02001 [Bacteroidetes bacterium ADurb.Bin141]|nr:MAG: hypothetical protein BWX95_02001 [Bacteroidetes bacterium ADurb.Bin141]
MKINTLKKITLLSLFLINVHLANAQGSVTPSELLTIAFEDATGARDTVYIGHYFDSCYLYINPPPTCPKIVSPNIDTAFGEVDLGAFVQPGVFTARIENKMSDGFAYDWYTKYDIRYCDANAQYAIWYNFFGDPLNYYIRFYNYTSPIIARISITRDSVFLPDSLDLGCFCAYSETGSGNNPHEMYGNGWLRGVSDSLGTSGQGPWWYDAALFPNLIDTITFQAIGYYVFYPTWIIVGIEEYNKDKSVKIFPNPVFSVLNISHDFNTELSYAIYSLKGDIIKSGKFSNNEINVADIKSGIYTINIINNNINITLKFLKL